MPVPPLHFMASAKPLAQKIVTKLVGRHGQAELASAICVVAVGGDGTTLKALQAVLATPHIPVFSMRTPGSVGALGNELALDGLIERLAKCKRIAIRPLQFEAELTDGSRAAGMTINEVVVIRQNFQAARLRLDVDSEADDIFGDGVLVASPIGSTGYCRSLGGPRLPLEADMIALAGIAVRRPAEGLLVAVPGDCTVRLRVTDPVYRPVRIETSSAIMRDVSEVTVRSRRNLSITLLLEPDEPLAADSKESAALADMARVRPI